MDKIRQREANDGDDNAEATHAKRAKVDAMDAKIVFSDPEDVFAEANLARVIDYMEKQSLSTLFVFGGHKIAAYVFPRLFTQKERHALLTRVSNPIGECFQESIYKAIAEYRIFEWYNFEVPKIEARDLPPAEAISLLPRCQNEREYVSLRALELGCPRKDHVVALAKYSGSRWRKLVDRIVPFAEVAFEGKTRASLATLVVAGNSSITDGGHTIPEINDILFLHDSNQMFYAEFVKRSKSWIDYDTDNDTNNL